MELEHILQKASIANPVKITSPIGLKTRGVGGARVTGTPPLGMNADTPNEIRSILTGKGGVLIKETWFYHVKEQQSNMSI